MQYLRGFYARFYDGHYHIVKIMSHETLQKYSIILECTQTYDVCYWTFSVKDNQIHDEKKVRDFEMNCYKSSNATVKSFPRDN